jgi:MFS family permease
MSAMRQRSTAGYPAVSRSAAAGIDTARIDTAALQRRTVWVLSLATVLGGLGIGASVSVGALLIASVTGNEAISGLAATMNGVGVALAGMPLARLAARRGRRSALALGNLIAVSGALLVVYSAVIGAGWLLISGLAVLGVASAVQLQSRFAATDLALPKRRARDLSLVVWAITIGAVTGPNLIGPGEWIGHALNLPPLTGIFAFTVVAQLAAASIVWFGLRPDPLLVARALPAVITAPITLPLVGNGDIESGSAFETVLGTERWRQVLVIVAVSAAHAVMVALMAMTPLHIVTHGGDASLVGFTISLHIAGMYALSPVFGILAGRIGSANVMILGGVILGIAAAGTAMAGDSQGLVQISLVLLGIGWSAATVAGSALLTTVTPARERPRRQGQSDSIMSASGAAAGALSGLIFASGGFPLLSLLSGALVLTLLVVSARLAIRR